MTALLEVKDLTIQVGNRTLVDHVRFQVLPGKCTAIVGESGSGKTLSCMSLLQLNPLQFEYPFGTLEFDEVITNNTAKLIPTDPQLISLRGRKIGMIFQEPMSALNPTMKVGEQVSEGMKIHLRLSNKEAKKKVMHLFQEVKIPNPETAYDKYPHEMSGGQRQRVMIAMALSCDPMILIADEPTTALDVSVQKAVLLLLKEIQLQRNIGMLFISHDLAVVKSIADQICVMQNGKVVEQGNASEVLHHPQHPYTKGLLACRPQGKKKGERLITLSETDTTQIQKFKTITTETILKVIGLSKKYGDFTAVHPVTFEIPKGQTLGLVGESGCGKTTLSRM